MLLTFNSVGEMYDVYDLFCVPSSRMLRVLWRSLKLLIVDAFEKQHLPEVWNKKTINRRRRMFGTNCHSATAGHLRLRKKKKGSKASVFIDGKEKSWHLLLGKICDVIYGGHSDNFVDRHTWSKHIKWD